METRHVLPIHSEKAEITKDHLEWKPCRVTSANKEIAKAWNERSCRSRWESRPVALSGFLEEGTGFLAGTNERVLQDVAAWGLDEPSRERKPSFLLTEKGRWLSACGALSTLWIVLWMFVDIECAKKGKKEEAESAVISWTWAFFSFLILILVPTAMGGASLSLCLFAIDISLPPSLSSREGGWVGELCKSRANRKDSFLRLRKKFFGIYWLVGCSPMIGDSLLFMRAKKMDFVFRLFFFSRSYGRGKNFCSRCWGIR